MRTNRITGIVYILYPSLVHVPSTSGFYQPINCLLAEKKLFLDAIIVFKYRSQRNRVTWLNALELLKVPYIWNVDIQDQLPYRPPGKIKQTQLFLL